MGGGSRGKDADSAEAPTMHPAAEQPKPNSRGLFLLQTASWSDKTLSPARTQNTTSSHHQVKPCKASQASLGFTLHRMGERSTNKAGQLLLPSGGSGRQSTALTWPQKPPGSGHWLGLPAGTATLPSSLSPGVQASREQGQRPGAVPPARGGPAGGRGCCTADGSSCWHPWWWRRDWELRLEAGAGPGGEHRGTVHAQVQLAGARLGVRVSVAGARGTA